MRNEINTLQQYFCPFGYLDVRAVCQIGDKLKLREDELFEIIDETRECLDYKNRDRIDPVWCVLDFVILQASEHIKFTTGYDFINDFQGDDFEIHVYANFLASCFDYSDEAFAELKEKIAWHETKLCDNKYCAYLLNELGITGT